MFTRMEFTAENNSEETRTLVFRLRNTKVAQRWAESIAKANRESFISQKNRWYNFPDDSGSKSNVIADRINSEILRINRIIPGKIPMQFDESRAQDCVNQLHVYFVEYDDAGGKDEQVLKAFSEINYLVHAYESCMRSRETERLAGIPEANIVVNWANPFPQPLEDEDFPEFTVAKKFGTCYLSYCQVGLHLYEMFLEKNEIVPEEQIRPLRLSSADTYIWLGSTTGKNSLANRKMEIERWFKKNEQKFSRLGLHWGDPKLAIGWLPVADLNPEISGLENQLQLLRDFSRFLRTSKVEVF